MQRTHRRQQVLTQEMQGLAVITGQLLSTGTLHLSMIPAHLRRVGEVKSQIETKTNRLSEAILKFPIRMLSWSIVVP